MSVEFNSKGSNGAKIWQDSVYPWRVYGAMGEGARAWALRPGLPCDDTTGDPTEFVVTVVEAGTGDSLLTVGEVHGYPLLLTTAADEYDGLNVQLRGETMKFASAKEAFIRGKFKLSEATHIDFLFGLCELKTDLMKTSAAHGVLATNVEGVFFVKVDGGTTIYVKAYKDGTETTSVSAGTMTTSDIDYALWWDGTWVHAYIDDVEVATFAGTLPDGECTPSINLRAGSAAARTASVAELAFVSIE